LRKAENDSPTRQLPPQLLGKKDAFAAAPRRNDTSIARLSMPTTPVLLYFFLGVFCVVQNAAVNAASCAALKKYSCQPRWGHDKT
jgi:hypothetical protein